MSHVRRTSSSSLADNARYRSTLTFTIRYYGRNRQKDHIKDNSQQSALCSNVSLSKRFASEMAIVTSAIWSSTPKVKNPPRSRRCQRPSSRFCREFQCVEEVEARDLPEDLSL